MCSEHGADKRLFYYQLASGATDPPCLNYNLEVSAWFPTATITRLLWLGLLPWWVGWLGPYGRCRRSCWRCSSCGFSAIRSGRSRTPPGAVVSPADGKVTEVSPVLMNGVPHTRISIFLSVFDVHVNRSPLAGVIREVRYQKGKFLNAMNPASAEHNEQNAVTVEGDGQTVVFKQIAGLLARRIVFNKNVGDRVGRGERVGLIKFGSRVDVLLDASAALQVKLGDRVKGGSSVLAHLESVTEPLTTAERLGKERSDGSRGPANPQTAKRATSAAVEQGMYILPSLFTTANIAFGYYAILQITHATVADPGTSTIPPRPLVLRCCLTAWMVALRA